MTICSRHTKRNGMILLLVMAMMAIFAMLVIAFMVVSQHASKSAGYGAKRGEIRDLTSLRTAEEDTHRAFLDLMVGSKNPNSVIYHHGIMPNLYGNPRVKYDSNDQQVNMDYLAGYVTGARWTGNSGDLVDANGVIFMTFEFSDHFTTSATTPAEEYEQYVELLKTLDMMGNIITFKDGNLKNKSLRIIDWNLRGSLTNFELELYLYSDNAVSLPDVDDFCFINSAPFSGTGVGYGQYDSGNDIIAPEKRGQPQLLLTDEDGSHYALSPNPTAPNYINGFPELRYYLDSNLVMVNPDHTAANTHSMFLSWFNNDIGVGIPSLHRPGLFESNMRIFQTAAELGMNADEYTEYIAEKRKRSMRPLLEDHWNFNGSNPAYTIVGPYDVDNDRDGKPESVWIYAGAPIYTDKYGKTYTKFISVLVKDMDSRLNANLHGNVAHLDSDYNNDTYFKNTFPVLDSTAAALFVFPVYGNDWTPLFSGATDSLVARGSGYGPAAVRLDYGLFNMYYDGANGSEAQIKARRFMENLFFGPIRDINTPGRFGIDGYTTLNNRTARRPGDPYLTATDQYSTPLELAKYFSVDSSGNYRISALDDRSLAYSPYGGRSPDYWEATPKMYDILGHQANAPYIWNRSDNENWADPPANSAWGVHLRNPYLQEPYGRTNIDEPFTITEFEALLRPNDGDSASLPQRLRNMFMGDIPFYDSSSDPISFDTEVTDLNWSDDTNRYREDDARIAGENLTVISSDIPSPHKMVRGFPGIHSLIVNCIMEENPATAGNRNYTSAELEIILEASSRLFSRLPREIRQGRRIDLNRLAKSPLWINVSGNASDHEAGLKIRAEYAQGIYIMLMAMCYEHIKNFDDGSVISSHAKKEDLIKTRLAQWAVNLVDFADRDGVMTPMLFDIEPFKIKQDSNNDNFCWDPDADMSLFANPINVKTALTTTGTSVRLLFGMERPDLVLTETMATHQRNVADTAEDITGAYVSDLENDNITRKDKDFDQVGIPEASAWFELYCTANPNQPFYDDTIYYFDTADDKWYLDLDLAVNDANGNPYSFWRIAISEGTDPMYQSADPSDPGSTDKYKSENARANVKNSIANRIPYPEFSFQPKQYRENGDGTDAVDDYNRSSVLGTESVTVSADEIELDRIVWLSSTVPSDENYDFERMFWNRTVDVAQLRLEPNEYLVIAPRITTNLGSKIHSTPGVGKYGTPSGLGIDFRTSFLDTTAGSGTMYDDIKAPKVIVCAANTPKASVAAGWSTTGNETDEYANLGIGIPGIGVNISAPLPTKLYYDRPTKPNTEVTTTGGANVYDGYLTPIGKPFEEARPAAGTRYPLSQDYLVGEGTVPYYKSAFLQRMADPLRAYDPITNPYITVDWNMMDLTVFMGESSGASTEEFTLTDEFEPPLKVATHEIRPSSRQWGRTAIPSSVGNIFLNPWMRLFDPAIANGGLEKFDSTTASAEVTTAILTAAFPYAPQHTLGRYNSDLEAGSVSLLWRKVHTDAAGYDEVYIGSPQSPFIHLPWNNAPYANAYEIMQVPASAPGRFGVEFIQRGVTATDKEALPENAGSLGTAGRFGFYDDEDKRIGHLLNFFHSSPEPDPNDSTNPKHESLNLAEFLEFVYVPSPYVGTERLLNYDSVAGDFIDDEPYTIPTFREPGKININTMNESAYMALRGDRVATNDHEDIFDAMTFDDTLPFELPFRSAAAANNTPLYVRNPADATLLRKETVLNTTTFEPTTTKERPLFAPLVSDDTLANTHNDVESIQRLSNLTTTRSNVFAVWVTVGYFEVAKTNPTEVDTERAAIGMEPLTGNDEFYAIYPDGYTFGRELGYDTGETVRHRAFYLIDRSIPVGVRQGEIHNIEDTILIRRVLE